MNLCKWGVLDRRPPACARSTAIICLLVYAESRDVKVAANFTRRCTATKRSRGREMKDRSSLKFRGTRTTSANLFSPPVYKVAPASFSITIKLPPHSLSKGRSARPLSLGLTRELFKTVPQWASKVSLEMPGLAVQGYSCLLYILNLEAHAPAL